MGRAFVVARRRIVVLLTLIVGCKQNAAVEPIPILWGDFEWGTPSATVMQELVRRRFRFVRAEKHHAGAMIRFVLSENIGGNPTRFDVDFVRDSLRRVAIVVSVPSPSETNEFYQWTRNSHVRELGPPLAEQALANSQCADEDPPVTCWQDEKGTTLTLRALPARGTVSLEYESPQATSQR
jgi:hypothetical protein